MAPFWHNCLYWQTAAHPHPRRIGLVTLPAVNRLEQVGVSSFRNSARAELNGPYPYARFAN